MFKNQDLSESLPESVVNIEEKTRSNLFTWRGQFSPQLIETLIKTYGCDKSKIYDPFVGSGTVLYEAGMLGLTASGCEINPAAVSFAKIFELINENKNTIHSIIDSVEVFISAYTTELPVVTEKKLEDFPTDLLSYYEKCSDPIEQRIISALMVGLDFESKKLTIKRILSSWGTLRSNIENLPYSKKRILCSQKDSRNSEFKNNFFDLVITSPPYINVFNYHQNYRKSVEMMGIDVLNIARSEIGSNRKFRGNRFLTVVQYSMDMAQVFCETSRVCSKDAKVIFIVGRESNVRKTPFKNALLLKKVAKLCGFKLEGQQHRKFTNKFGKLIYEEILRFTIDYNIEIEIDKIIEHARKTGIDSLKNARKYCSADILPELEEAIIKSKNIETSPILGALN